MAIGRVDEALTDTSFSLSRMRRTDNTNLDVVLLPCGHAFHSTCLDDHACAICLDASLETLAWSFD